MYGVSLREAGPGRYSSWKEVAGYFDGDGNVGLEVVTRVLRFRIRFVDTWRPQIEAVSALLVRQGLRCGSIGKGSTKGVWQAAYRLDVTEVRSVILAAKAMRRYAVKKREELGVVVDYLEERITGNQAIRDFNEGVKSGRRRGKIRFENVPYTRDEGLRLSQLGNARKAREAHAVDVPLAVQDDIRRDHSDRRVGHILLSRKYGYSVSVIRRILGER